MQDITKKIQPILEKIGLNPIENAVFLANFELGSARASEIAKKAELNRVTSYEALKRLSKKGLVKIRAKQNTAVKYFEVANVEELENVLNRQKGGIEQALKDLQIIAPDLNSLFSGKSEKPVVLFFEGKEGIKNILLDTLAQKPSEILSFASADFLEVGYEQGFLESYWTKRTSLKIPSRGLMPKTDKAISFFNSEKNQKQLRRIKFIPKEYYNFENEIDIYGSNISIISLRKGEEYGVIIRSKNIAKGLRAVYELLWSVKFSGL